MYSIWMLQSLSIKYDPCINGGMISCKLIGQRRTVPEFRMGWYIIENNFIIWHPVVCSGLSIRGKQVLLIQFYNYYYVQHLNATEFICGITLSPSLENVPFNILYCIHGRSFLFHISQIICWNQMQDEQTWVKLNAPNV
jgi:hypothetical protein